jgi:membrane-associated phospholipid phosphatase
VHRRYPVRWFAITQGIPSALLLYYLNAPRNLLIIILGVTAAMFVTALVNIWYHSSLHLAMVTSMLTSMVFLLSNTYLLSFILLPILGLSRYQLGEHTPLQTVTGFFIGLAVGGAVFYSLGLAA